MKKQYPIFFAIWPYLAPLALLIPHSQIAFILWIFCVLAAPVVYIVNIIYVCRFKDDSAFRQLAFWDMIIKLCHIPFYLFMAILGMFTLLVMVVPAFIFTSPAIVLMLIASNYLLLASSSSYGVSALVRAKAAGKISARCMVVNIILHFFFVLDVISSIYVFFRLKASQDD